MEEKNIFKQLKLDSYRCTHIYTPVEHHLIPCYSRILLSCWNASDLLQKGRLTPLQWWCGGFDSQPNRVKVFHVPQFNMKKILRMFISVLFTRFCLYQYQIHLIHWTFFRLCAVEILKSFRKISFTSVQSVPKLMVSTLQPISPSEKLIQVLQSSHLPTPPMTFQKPGVSF